MDSKAQAQKGFKTFMLTLVVSLFVFSAIYVVLNRNSEDTYAQGTTVSANATGSTAGTQNGDAVNSDSVFNELANKPADVQTRAVLAAGDAMDGMSAGTTTPTTTGVGDTAPESTVPSTGITGPTAGIIISTTIFGIVGYILLMGPRKLALSSFERNVLRDLE